MSEAELSQLLRALRVERWKILRQLEQRQDEERGLSADQHDVPMDAPERGSDLASIELTEKLADRSARRFVELTRALDRAHQGRLAICASCGGPIPLGRLQALPGVITCVACAEGAGEPAPAGREGPLPTEPSPAAVVLPGRKVYTRAGEGIVQRIAPFGTCGECGEVEGRYDELSDEVRCTRPGCELPLTDVEELAVVQLGEETITTHTEELRPVDPQPYD